jgi:hypothetical protein
MTDTTTLYDEDFVVWSKEQAEALRAIARGATNQPIDWENVAEEIESLGVSQKSALRSQMRRIVLHLLKLEFSSAQEPRRGWFESVSDARGEIEDLFEMSPSLKADVEGCLAMAHRQGSRKAIFELDKHGERDRAAIDGIRAKIYTADQILGDWFPPDPPEPSREK